MYKTIKIPEMAFRNANELKAEVAKEEDVKGVRKVTLSEAVSYAIKETLKELKRKQTLASAAGGWSDIDAESLIKDLYASRSKRTRLSQLNAITKF